MSPLVLPPVTPERILKYLFVGICLAFFSMYAYFQARNLIHGPSVTLSSEIAEIQEERAVTLHGIAKNVVLLKLNGREIHTNEQGEFEEALMLENGYTIMTLFAEDRYGRSTELTRTFIYKPQS